MNKKTVSYKTQENKIKLNKNKETIFTSTEAIEEFEELKKMALNCLDKNGNPNINAAIKALENKAKIAGLYSKTKQKTNVIAKMTEIKIDGEQLKFKIGEEIKENENP